MEIQERRAQEIKFKGLVGLGNIEVVILARADTGSIFIGIPVEIVFHFASLTL
jgi:hypothetical protein